MRLIEPNQITKMMSDLYISEDAVNMTGERQGLWVRFRAIEKAASEIPTIEAVEVVRCKECKWWGGNKNTEHNNHICNRALIQEVDYWTRADDYCSHGERKGGDDE